jgi:hypothetical protein
MRRITDEEVLLVTGGGYLEEAMAAISAFFGGSSSVQCVPGSVNTGNGGSITQSCSGSSSTLTIQGQGYVVIQTTTGGASGGISFRNIGATITDGSTVTTTTVINGQSTTVVTK